MYGLPLGETFEFFIGFILTSFSISRHQVNIVFTSPATAMDTAVVSIEGRLGVQLSGQGEHVFDALPNAAHHLAKLIDLGVANVQLEEPGTLGLQFADGSAVRVFDSSEHYESYQVIHLESVFVI